MSIIGMLISNKVIVRTGSYTEVLPKVQTTLFIFLLF